MALGKRGNVGDLMVIVVILFVLGVSWLIGYTILNKYNDSVNEKGISQDAQTILNKGKQTGGILDNMILFVMIGLSLFSIISAYFVDTHPAFLFISILVLVIIIAISATVSNVYEDFSNSTTISETATSFAKTNWVVEHAPLFVVVTGMIILLILFAKWQRF